MWFSKKKGEENFFKRLYEPDKSTTPLPSVSLENFNFFYDLSDSETIYGNSILYTFNSINKIRNSQRIIQMRNESHILL